MITGGVLAEQHIGPADDRIERRAQIVRQPRQPRIGLGAALLVMPARRALEVEQPRAFLGDPHDLIVDPRVVQRARRLRRDPGGESRRAFDEHAARAVAEHDAADHVLAAHDHRRHQVAVHGAERRIADDRLAPRIGGEVGADEHVAVERDRQRRASVITGARRHLPCGVVRAGAVALAAQTQRDRLRTAGLDGRIDHRLRDAAHVELRGDHRAGPLQRAQELDFVLESGNRQSMDHGDGSQM